VQTTFSTFAQKIEAAHQIPTKQRESDRDHGTGPRLRKPKFSIYHTIQQRNQFSAWTLDHNANHFSTFKRILIFKPNMSIIFIHCISYLLSLVFPFHSTIISFFSSFNLFLIFLSSSKLPQTVSHSLQTHSFSHITRIFCLTCLIVSSYFTLSFRGSQNTSNWVGTCTLPLDCHHLVLRL
jgi:hypothetical protein